MRTRRSRFGARSWPAGIAAILLAVGLAGCGPDTKTGAMSCYDVVKTWNARVDAASDRVNDAEQAGDYGRANDAVTSYNQVLDGRSAALDAAGC